MRIARIKTEESRPSEGTIRDRASRWLGLEVDRVKQIDVYLIDLPLEESEVRFAREEILVDPVLEESFESYSGEDELVEGFGWIVQIGLKPGMKDGEGERAKDAIEDLLGRELEGNVYTAREYLIKGELTREDANSLAVELLANDLVNRITVIDVNELDERASELEEAPEISGPNEVDVRRFSLAGLSEISARRNLALSEEEIGTIKRRFNDKAVRGRRREVGPGEEITDVELEIIAQTQSEHCKHKIFNGKISYENRVTGTSEEIDSLMDTYIVRSSREIDRDWVLSSFWDNSGVIEFDEDYAAAFKFETHNSPSAKDPYGGAITGIVGVYRDPMGTGRGSRIVAGAYGFVTPYPSYNGPLKPEIKPRRLLEGIVEGVRDGGNKSGVPTITGYSKFDDSFLGKPLVYVGAVGLMPREVSGERGWEKDLEDGDLMVIAGGRVGRDGIHGVTESSLEFDEDITSGHVQIGDPFTQKKVQEFILEARDEGLLKLTWDLGGGGLSSAVGETAEFSGGCVVDLEKAPLKYEGLKPWEIMVSESQERMLLGIDSSDLSRLNQLADRHDVEIAAMGKFTESGYLRVNYGDEVVAHLELDFLHDGFPRYELEAVWSSPDRTEPDLTPAKDPEEEFLEILSRPNVASKKWIQRQYDHEVQGNTVVKPLTGKNPVRSDASVIKPLPDGSHGLALGLANNFHYSLIDPYWMAASSLEEALRRVIAVGADPDRIALNDNFTWPNCLYDEEENPEGRENLGKLVRANKALYRFSKEFGTPCISGKDSMFITGNLRDESGEVRKISGIPALQFSALGRVNDVRKSRNLRPQREGDLIYLVGTTRDELGASEYYEYRGETGANVPRVKPDETKNGYEFVHKGIERELLASVHGIYRGGLGVSLAEMALASGLGLRVELARVPSAEGLGPIELLYSETPSRFLVTAEPEKSERVEELISDVTVRRIGTVGGDGLEIIDRSDAPLIDVSLAEIKKSYYEPFEKF